MNDLNVTDTRMVFTFELHLPMSSVWITLLCVCEASKKKKKRRGFDNASIHCKKILTVTLFDVIATFEKVSGILFSVWS